MRYGRTDGRGAGRLDDCRLPLSLALCLGWWWWSSRLLGFSVSLSSCLAGPPLLPGWFGRPPARRGGGARCCSASTSSPPTLSLWSCWWLCSAASRVWQGVTSHVDAIDDRNSVLAAALRPGEGTDTPYCVATSCRGTGNCRV